MAMGQCVLLPSLDSEWSLLLTSPFPADQYDHELRRNPLAITFVRTEHDEIIIPAGWLRAKLEELSTNPAASSELKALALTLSRRAVRKDIVLPVDLETIALFVRERDGGTTLIEALPAGSLITFR